MIYLYNLIEGSANKQQRGSKILLKLTDRGASIRDTSVVCKLSVMEFIKFPVRLESPQFDNERHLFQYEIMKSQ